ncbi:hypothetical protein [Streptomyces chartreusis]|uniref:Uncharacterized protein n=1 Tax=Streptomyces chartreusis TaxID=1969 RepID=A0A7H8T0K1_STRCX|nr:hypothetical protein [Streptomyces chartreusis]QKZ17037.1 hypothetical protein HUT05_06425 [Streptomyces chartreusis]
MESELLDDQDYASVHQAMQLLSSRYLHALTLNARMTAWAEVVTSAEGGFADRDWLHDAWPILTERIRRLRQPKLDARNALPRLGQR